MLAPAAPLFLCHKLGIIGNIRVSSTARRYLRCATHVPATSTLLGTNRKLWYSIVNMAPHADHGNGASQQDEDHPSIFAPLEPGLSDAVAKEKMPRFPT